MVVRRQQLAALSVAVAAAFVSTAALAESLASSASSAASQSVGSSSESFRASSNSSSTDNRTANGRYRVDAVVAVADRPGRVRLDLTPLDGPADGAFGLELPELVRAEAGIAAGTVVAARPRPYGVEFALAETRQPFYLVLEDAWYRELAAHRVTL